MDRRQFIKGFFAALVVAQVVQLPGPAATPLGELSDYQKGRIIAEALKTKGGRDALARSMTQPLLRRLDYGSIGRQAFMVQELPQGATPIYSDPDFDAAAYVVGGKSDLNSINDPETNEAIRQLYSEEGRRMTDSEAVDKIAKMLDLEPEIPQPVSRLRRVFSAISRLFA